jgi:hypothetical protein
MALHGTLDEFSIEGVLRLLEWSGSVGVLHVEASDREASVWVRQGSCVWAQTDLGRAALTPAEAVVDAVFELSLLRAGLFRFHACAADDLHPRDSAPRKLRDVLKEVGERRSAWTRTLSRLPSLDQLVELAPGDPPGDITIRPAEWRVLSRIEGGRTLRQLLSSGDGLWRTGDVLVSLIESGLVCVADRPPEQRSLPRARLAEPSALVDEIAMLGELSADETDAAEDGTAAEPDLVLVPLPAPGDGTDPDADEDDVRRLAGEVLRDLSRGQQEATADDPGRAQRGRIIRLLSGDR